MAIKQDLIKNFLITDTRDFALKISNDEKNILSVLNYIDKKDLINFFQLNSKNKIYFNFSEKKEDPIKSKNKIFAKVKKINSIASDQNKESGIWPLHLCYLFIKGQVNSKIIKAPIALIPISIEREDNNFALIKKDNLIINEKLNYFLDLHLNTNLSSVFEKMENNNIDLNFERIIKIYKENLAAFDIELILQNAFEKFEFESNSEINKITKLTIDYSACISLLDPIGGKIKKDIMEIESRQEDPFKKADITKNNDNLKNDLILNDNLIEFNNLLNINQKYAVFSSLTENTIIKGPPGTGKSEVIVNIIINSLLKGKTTLLSSEKKTALDVVENRLDSLKLLCLSSIDNKNPNEFYKKIDDFRKLLSIVRQQNKLESHTEFYKKIISNFESIKLANKNKFLNYENDFFLSKIYLSRNIYNKNTQNIFNYFYEYIFKNKKTIKECFLILEILKKNCERYIEAIDFLRTKKCEINDIEKLSKLISKYNDSKDKNFLLSNFLLENKIKIKTLFDRKKSIVNFDSNKIISFFLEIVKMNFDGLNINLLTEIISYNSTYENFEIGIFEKHFELINNKNHEILIYESFSNYLYKKNRIAKSVSSCVLENYIHNFLNIYNKLTVIEKNKIDEVFSYSVMNKKRNVILFASKFYEQLRLIFPIWIINPINASIILPNTKNIFDYGIFDEASQMFLEKSFPLIYRSKTSIIAGDDKQLKPSSFFSSRNNDDSEDNFDTAESLLEKANSSMWSTFVLKNHYRSNSADLIEFSNKFFYKNMLYFVTKNNCFYKGIDVIDVDGIWNDNTNEIEANKIIELILENSKSYESILIISFNEKQNDLIENKFIENFCNNNLLFNKYNAEKIRFRTLENAQGNEADLVILSVSFGYNKENKFNQFFGPISHKNGENRLNVAITRAKSKMIVVKSFKLSDLKINQENNSSQIFYYFINFLDNIKNRNNELKEIKKDNNFFYEYIYSIVKKMLPSSFVILKNVSIGSIPTDIIILDNAKQKIFLIININRLIDLSSLSNTMENMYNALFLKSRNYDVLNIDEVEFLIKSNKVIRNLLDKLNSISKKNDTINLPSDNNKIIKENNNME